MGSNKIPGAVVGQRFGRLIVVEILGTDGSPANKRLALCLCDCGKNHTARINNLHRKTKSCGCFKADGIKLRMGKPIEHLASRALLNSCIRMNKDCDLTQDEVKQMMFSKCFYCEGTPEEVGTVWQRAIRDGRQVKRIGLDRVDSSRGYYRNNVVPCCFVCNKIKRELDPSVLLARMKKFVVNLEKLVNK